MASNLCSACFKDPNSRGAKGNNLKMCEICQIYSFHLSCVAKGVIDPQNEAFLFHCPDGKGCNVEENEDLHSLKVKKASWKCHTCKGKENVDIVCAECENCFCKSCAKVTDAGLQCYRMLGRSFKWFCNRCVTCFDLKDKTTVNKTDRTASEQNTEEKKADGQVAVDVITGGQDATDGTTCGPDTEMSMCSRGIENAAGDQSGDGVKSNSVCAEATGKFTEKESKSDLAEQLQGNSPKVKKAKLCRFNLKNKCRYGVSGKGCGFTHLACESGPNKNNQDESEKQQKQVPTVPSLKHCKFYLKNKCRHGVSGSGCGFTHPKRCNKFMELGWHGCKSDKLCKKFHPRVCNDSYHHMLCTKQECDFLHIRKTRKPLEHKQNVAYAANRQGNGNTGHPQQQHTNNKNLAGQNSGGQHYCVPQNDTPFCNHAQRFPTVAQTKNYPRHNDQGSRPSCDGGRPFCESRESSAVAVHGHHHCSVDQSQRRHFLETLENLLSCPCKPPLPQMRESPTQR